MVVSVEEVASSVVREYLNRKAQNSPLKTLLEIIVKHHFEGFKQDKIPSNESDPRLSDQAKSWTSNSPAVTPTVMNNKNTEDSTTAFVMSKHNILRSDRGDFCTSQPETDPLSSHYQTGFWAYDLEEQKDQPLRASLHDNERLTRSETEKQISITESTQRSRSNRIRRGMMAGPIASTAQDSNKKRQNRKLEGPHALLKEVEDNRQSGDGVLVAGKHRKRPESSQIRSADCVEGQWEMWSAPERLPRENSFEKVQQDVWKTTKVKSLSSPNVADLDVSEMVLDDIDDDEDLGELSKVSFHRTVAEHSHAGYPMDQHTAMELKAVLLGTSLNCFSVEWRNQGLTFSETHDLRYGIVQKKGGPCGVLASFQAFVLKKLLFENTESGSIGLQRLRPSNSTRRKCLVLAAAEILWRAGEEKQAIVAINSGRNHFTPAGHYKSEGVLEKFETGALGCLLLSISALLSRTIQKYAMPFFCFMTEQHLKYESVYITLPVCSLYSPSRVREDMDVHTNTLIGAHGYCTQELVSLLLCGRAVSNVFDNDIELDSGNGNMTLLKGVQDPCDVGLLSLFEHYNICKVGAYLKTPHYPIWVVCSESHFSVLFGLQRELRQSTLSVGLQRGWQADPCQHLQRRGSKTLQLAHRQSGSNSSNYLLQRGPESTKDQKPSHMLSPKHLLSPLLIYAVCLQISDILLRLGSGVPALPTWRERVPQCLSV
ncbi:hypothetical protein F7725_027698, partial [Dissostichus mawsoni]